MYTLDFDVSRHERIPKGCNFESECHFDFVEMHYLSAKRDHVLSEATRKVWGKQFSCDVSVGLDIWNVNISWIFYKEFGWQTVSVV
jgi:hypothetical protein